MLYTGIKIPIFNLININSTGKLKTVNRVSVKNKKMKKLLLSTIVLTGFALSMCLFELSCKKTADAAPVVTTTTPLQQNKLIYVSWNGTVGQL